MSPLAKYKLVMMMTFPIAYLQLTRYSLKQHALLQVFLGDQSVGKTSIITRFMYDKFDNTYQV